MWGAWIFLLTYIFLYQYDSYYDFAQKISQGFFKIVAPFERFFSYLFPTYPIIVCILFFAVKKFLGIDTYNDYFLFFIGFTITMHVLLTASALQDEEQGSIKPNYLLTIAVVFIFNAILIVFLLDFVHLKVTFTAYFTDLVNESKDIYLRVIGVVSG